MESFQDWRRRKRYDWPGNGANIQTVAMVQEYHKEADWTDIGRLKELLVDMYHDCKDDRLIDAIKIIETIKEEIQ